MTSREYWKKRALLLEALLHDRSEETLLLLARLYDLAQEELVRQIERIFARYCKGGALTQEQALRLLTVRETEELRAELEEMLQTAEGEAKREIWARLAAPAYANRISRLQALRDRLYCQCLMLGVTEARYVRDRLADTLEQSYYRTIFDAQKQAGGVWDFERLGSNQITAALATEWSGKNWSQRLWNNNRKFARDVQETVTVGIMTGQTYPEMRDNLLHTIGTEANEGAKYNAARLVKTECAYVANQGHLMGYQQAGIETYIYLATLDLRTSEICRSLDMKKFPVADAQAGTNLPPMHPHCRSTTMPDTDADILKKLNRFARDPVTGEAISVPGNMTYQQWYHKYVAGNPDALAAETAVRNRAKDRKQFREYHALLGEEMPQSVDAFQKMKYTEPEKWDLVKLDYSRRTALAKHPALKLPNAESATAAEDKFTKYLFNEENEKGIAKGRAFAEQLGYNGSNWQGLRRKILEGAEKYPATPKQSDQYGTRYQQQMILYGDRGQPANVVVGWNVRPDGTVTMTTAFVKKVKKS